MADFTALEQLFLELVNRARMDPAGEAARYGISLNSNLPAGTINATPKQVLASNLDLGEAADFHSNYMLANNQFNHTGIGDGDPGSRMADAGYVFSGSWTWGENIAWTSGSGINGIYQHHGNLFKSAGHRKNILNDSFKEIGIGSMTGEFNGWTNSLMSTQNFARSGSGTFVTGVSYVDSTDDNFYTVGEGMSDRSLFLYSGSSLAGQATTLGAGGYSLKTTATGSVEGVFSGGGLGNEKGVMFNLAGANVKIDMVDGATIEANVSITLTRGSTHARLLGIENIGATGNGYNNNLSGNKGANTLSGLSGNDKIWGGSGNDSLIGGVGSDTLDGGSGYDKYIYNASNEGGDTINYFSAADTIVFKGSAFGGLSAGALNATSFRASANGAAGDANDRFLFNTATDTLYFDADGTGAGAAVKIADIIPDYAMTAADILIV